MNSSANVRGVKQARIVAVEKVLESGSRADSRLLLAIYRDVRRFDVIHVISLDYQGKVIADALLTQS